MRLASVGGAMPALAADVKAHKASKGALECVVCLSEFDDDETLRLLPKCSHVFHPDRSCRRPQPRRRQRLLLRWSLTWRRHRRRGSSERRPTS